MAEDKALQVLAPEVRTLARPASGPLVAARGVVQRSGAIQGLFTQAKAEGWDAGRLSEAIEAPLGEALASTPDEVRQVALYLAAEYLQFGDTLLLISRETGRAIARITEEDIWQPPMVPRESGGLAKPLPRLRPELEGFLYQYVHDHDREARLTSELAVRTRQTAFLAAEGDRRLFVSTRQGRRAIEQEIQARAEGVLEGATGLVREFLMRLAGPTTAPIGLTALAMARTRMEISDLVAVNYRFDHATGQYMNLVNEWVREIARTLGIEAHQQRPARVVRHGQLQSSDFQGANFWIADPRVAPSLFAPGVSVLIIPGARTVGLVGSPVGSLVLTPGSLTVEGREMLGHWDVMGRFQYTLHLDWEKVVALDVQGIPEPLPVVEVLTR